jgi:hypothetical protein
MASIDDFKKLKAEQLKLREEAKVKAKEIFASASKALFAEYADLESFSWTQYTPYFNDGDSCTFSVNRDWGMKVNGEDIPSSYQKDKRKPVHEAVSAFLDVFDDDDLYDMFEDHVRITVTKDGTETESYDHD